MNNLENEHIEYKLESDYTPEQLSSIKKDQLSELENIIDEKMNNSSEEFNLYTLIFLEIMIADIIKMPKYYLDVTSIINKINTLISKVTCSSNLDTQAKELLVKCNKSLIKKHSLPLSLETQLHNIKLEYYKTINL